MQRILHSNSSFVRFPQICDRSHFALLKRSVKISPGRGGFGSQPFFKPERKIE